MDTWVVFFFPFFFSLASLICCIRPQTQAVQQTDLLSRLLNSNCSLTSSRPPLSYVILFLPLHASSLLPLSFLFHSPMRPSSDFQTEPRTSGLLTGKISGSQHQISRFLGYIRRADTFLVRLLHKGYGPNDITQGRMWVESSRVMSVHECGCAVWHLVLLPRWENLWKSSLSSFLVRNPKTCY